MNGLARCIPLAVLMASLIGAGVRATVDPLPVEPTTVSLAGSPGSAAGREGVQTRTCEVTVPDEWGGVLSVGDLAVIGPRRYVAWRHGLWTGARIKLPLKNLTAGPLYVLLEYRSEGLEGGDGIQIDRCYTLPPNQERVVHTFVRLPYVEKPVRFRIRALLLRRPPRPEDDPRQTMVVVEPFPFAPPRPAESELEVARATGSHFEVKGVRLANSEREGNVLLAKVRNGTDRDIPLGGYVAVNHPRTLKERGPLGVLCGSLSDFATTVVAQSQVEIPVAYTIPEPEPGLLLGFTLFEPWGEPGAYAEGDLRERDLTLVAWGAVDLSAAVARGDCVLPTPAPVEERANLTEQTQSEHFVFHYRPDSYAEEHLDLIIEQREGAYRRLSGLLNMELPLRVRFDLYPDMKAKGLGSGTPWTPSNTVSDSHVAEVYNEGYQEDVHHELAHIFSCHFPGHSRLKLSKQEHAPGKGLVEAFANYFQAGLAASGSSRAQEKLEAGELTALGELLAAPSPVGEHYAVIDFLLRKDVEKFKEFYVRVVGEPTAEGIQKAAKEVYGVMLDELEADWHEWLRKGAQRGS